MSIQINKDKCRKCGKCLQVCPGDLIQRGRDKKAEINHSDNCWGCTACIKECPYEAIELYLGKELGGKGTKLTARDEEEAIRWKITYVDGKVDEIRTMKRESNQY